MIRDLDAAKAENVVKKIMTLNSVQEISELLLKEYKEILPLLQTDENL